MVKVFKEDKEIPPIKIGANVKERASLVAQTVKNLPVMWETWIQSLGWEYLLEEEMETHIQSCLTLCNRMDCSPPGSSVHGILQARNWSG